MNHTSEQGVGKYLEPGDEWRESWSWGPGEKHWYPLKIPTNTNCPADLF